MLTVKEAAARTGVSDSLLYEWCAQKLLPHYRFGTKGKRGKVMIDETDLDVFLASCRREGATPPIELPLKHIRLNG